MKPLSVIELSKLYGMNRQSIYKRINKGDLTKNSDGKIDLAEAIRVFGEPSKRSNAKQSQVTDKSAEVDSLKQTVDMLKKQLQLAEEREAFQREELRAKSNQIESLQMLLNAPKPQATAKEIEREPESVKMPHSANEGKIERNSEPKRRGLLARVVRAVLD
jgi:hypothetical protein